MSYDDQRGEEYEAAKYGPHLDPCDCDVCRRAEFSRMEKAWREKLDLFDRSKAVFARPHLPELPQATSYRYVGRSQQPTPTNQPVPLESGADAPTHLPECDSFQPFSPSLNRICICAAVSACEQRVREEVNAEWWGKSPYQQGVRAAREAVAAAQAEAGDINFCKDCADWSVAAIDALKEKP